MVIQQVHLSQVGLDFIQNPQRTGADDLGPQFMRSVTEIYLRIHNNRLEDYADFWGWFDPLFVDQFTDTDLQRHEHAGGTHPHKYRHRWRQQISQSMNADSDHNVGVPVIAGKAATGWEVITNQQAAMNTRTQAYVVIGAAPPNNPPAPPPPPQFPLGLTADGETVNRRSNSPQGWLYVLIHPNFPGWVKIGRTRNLGKRLSSYNTGTPNAANHYVIEYHHPPDGAQPYAHATPVERAIHTALRPTQDVGDTREWYQMTVEEAIAIINQNLV